ncbi:MAG: hypothetical protein H6579_02940 [Chitinophagales bacterium]|nr:hypothetical protein [Chitinophagales bacterium]
MKHAILILFVFFSFAFQPCFAQDDEISEEELELLMEEFRSDFKTVVKDFPNNFQNIKGAKITDEANYESLIPLNLAEESYLSPRTFTDELAFVAVCGEFEDEEVAKNVHALVKYLIETTKFDFSLLSKQIDNENEMMDYWLVWDLNSDRFSNMVIKLRRFSVPTFNFDPGMPSETYHVVINIERIKS